MLVKSYGSKAMVEASLNSTTLRILKGIPSQSKWVGSKMVFEPTPDALKYLQLQNPDIKWSECIQPALDAALYLDLHRKTETGAARPLDFQFKTKPYEHQLRAFLQARDKPAFAYFMEQGTGKTKLMIDEAAYNWSQGKIDALFVVADNGIHRNWVDNELPVHMPDWVDWKAWWWKAPSSASKTHTAKWNEAAEHPGLSVLCANVESFSYDHIAKLFKPWMARRNVMMVVDESTSISEPAAALTKNVLKLGDMAVMRRIATGTPASEGPLKLYTQFKFLDEKMLGYPDYHSFKSTYAILSELGEDKTFQRWKKDPDTGKSIRVSEPIKIVVGYRDVEHLNGKIEPHSFRVLKKDCLDLPEKVYQKWPVEMSAEQKRLYKELKDRLVIEVGDKIITAPMAMTLTMRFRQLLGGYPGGEALKEQPRISALQTWTSHFPLSTKAIIWAVFRPEIEAIRQCLSAAYPGAVVEYHGGVSEEARAQAIHRFQTDSGCRFFIANQATAGKGLTLTAASQVGYYSNDWPLEARQQSEDRAHRIGQKNTVTYTDFHTPDTIEDRVFEVLRGKKLMSDRITGDELISWI